MSSGQTDARNRFDAIVAAIAHDIGERPLDAALEDWLNQTCPAGNKVFNDLAALIGQGCEEGWLCQRETGGIRFGRVIKPRAAAGRFSVDVVRMNDVKGPHHVHPQGEIGMIVALSGAAEFDGRGPGWYVYGPGTAHWPTVTGGEAYVLYLLPDGEIEFTGC
jgi:hypothetical protein